MPTLTLRIENMHCGSCVRRVMQTLNALPGTHAEEVRLGAARVSAPDEVEPMMQALQAAGFPAHLEMSNKQMSNKEASNKEASNKEASSA